MDEFKELLAGKEFDADELELLSYLLEEEGVERDAGATEAPPILPRAGDAHLPLSFAQQRLWFLAQLQPTSAAYNMPGLLRLAGRLDLAALTQSLAEIVRRHEALRTTFHVVAGEPVQRIAAAPAHFELPVEDLTHLTGARQTAEVQQRAVAEARRPFDLTKGPLVRARLLRLAGTEHVLLVTMHHIVSDGWSIGIFIRELATIYVALVHDRPAPLATLPIQYADYAIWQRQWLTGTLLDEQLAYWRARLAGDLPVLQLPTDHPRPAEQTFNGATQTVTLPASVSEQLRALAAREGATLFMTLLAAWQTLLARYSGQTDILVGSPVANRARAEVEALIGFFVNTLVLRTDLSGDPPFTELLARVREMCLGAYAHQDVPFEMLVEELQPERDRSRTPLFQVTFALEHEPLPDADVAGMRWSAAGIETGDAKFDLTLELTETDAGLAGLLQYNTDLFDAPTIARMAAHFETLVAGIVADPAARISKLPLLTPAEHEQLLGAWNETAAPYPRELCLHQIFARQAAATPEAVAVIFGDEQLTYAELNRRANQLAHRLRRLGVGPEVRVGVLMERSLELVVALFGILKAGGAYVPLDPAYPQDRLAYMLADSSVSVLVAQDELRARVPDCAAHVLSLAAEAAQLATEDAHDPDVPATPEQLIYVIYTSGSTGRPKGVMLPHRGVVNCLCWLESMFHLDAQDRVLVKASLSFDASVWELFWPLLVGASAVLARPGGQQDSAYLAAEIARRRVTTVHFVPSMLPVFLDEKAVGGLTSLRRVLCGGEALPLETMQRFCARLPAELHNFYGPTETSIGSIDARCEPASLRAVVPIGRPIANTSAFILDPQLRPVPIGVQGELYIGGDGLARGYLARPELTAERFIPDPFAQQPGARLYRTGDLARYLPDGQIDFLGRIDSQVKLRGFRIELEEIEAVLGGHAGVRECLVMAREDVPGDKRLVAYVVAHAHAAPPAPAELRRHLKERLPEYMLPAAFVFLDELPLAPSGKVDKRALLAPDRDTAANVITQHDAPRNAVEEVLCGIFADVLQLARVGVHANFFELGGHSLLATQVVARLRDVLQVELPLNRFFESASVAELAALVEQELQAGRTAQAPPLRPAPRTGDVPLSFAQQRLWFIDQLEPGNPVYNVPGAVRLEGPLDVPALERALNEIVRRHEALRTIFTSRDGQPAQVVLADLPVPLNVFDLAHLPAAERAPEMERLAQQEAQRPFDLARGPLLRAHVLRLGAAEHVLLFTLHHIVSDGWSMGVLVREVAALYEAHAHGGAISLPDLPVQYADYAVWQREWLQGDVLDEQLAYWRQQLAGAPPVLELPTDRPRPKVQTFRGAALALELPRDLTDELKSLSRREGVTLFMTLLAAWQTLLARYSGQTDILVGSPIANRRRSEIENLIGFFANTLVLRTDLSGDPTFSELLTRVREVCLGAYAHQDVPFEMLVEELQPERSLAHTPLFQVLLVLQNAPGAELSLPGLKLTPLLPQSGTSKFDLMMFLEESEAGLGGVFEYNTDLFDEATIRRLLQHFEQLLRASVAAPRTRISALPLLDEAEARRLLVEWNDTATEFPRDLCIHELVEQQAAATPEAVAVIFGDEQLTYAELNARANQLAHTLRAHGVGPEVVVGLLVTRSLAMLVGVLGVLKAGGAYLPLDVEHPRERLAFMLADARARVLLTETHLRERSPDTSAQVLTLDADWAAIARAPQVKPTPLTTAENAAYVIYTSGSTGKPKAVVMQHRAAVNLITFQRASSGAIAAAPRTLQFAPLSFDVSFQEIFSTWAAGGTLVLLTDDERRDARELLRVIERQQVERLFLPFVALQHLAEAAVEAERVPASLRAVITAGEQLKITRQVEQFFTRSNDCVLDNHYGPTETHLVTMWRLAGAAHTWPALPSIGRPIANARVYVLDDAWRPVPTGVAGELYVGGAGLARGYLDRPGQTAARFIPDPFSGQPGARLYRTGDVARYLADGRLEYLGRVDNQVKIRGFRIEIGEVEAVIKQHGAVKQAVVNAHEDAAGHKRLVAYVVAKQGAACTPAALRDFLKAQLPEYMIPAAFVFLAALPLTPSGKVDRRALPAPDETHAALAGDHVAPRSPVEEMLAGLWGEVLGLQRVGVHDNFFDLGGHSLLATQLMSRVRNAFQVEIALRTLFEQPTVAELAGRIAEQMRAGRQLSAPPVRPVARVGALPLSFAQQRLWFLSQLEPESASYHLPAAVRLIGSLDRAALARSLARLVERHEVLRTTFQTVAGQPVQVVAPAPPPDLPFVDLRALAETARAAELQRHMRAEAQRPFDLAQGPLLRAELLCLAETEHVLLVTMHHIVSDGWSMGVLVREVAALYEAYTQGTEAALADLSIQYADYAVWQREWLQGDVLAEQLAYWRQQLAGAPPVLELPTDKPRPAVKTYHGATQTLELPAQLRDGLQELSRREGVTLFMTLLAAWQTLLARYSGQTDILVGSPVANRARAEVEALIGFFVNTLVLRTDLSGDPPFTELLARVREVCLGAYAHQDVPFEMLVEELQPERSLSHTPLFQVAFALQNTPMPSIELAGVQLTPLDVSNETAKFDLTISLTETPDGLAGLVEYNTDLFEPDTIARLRAHFQLLLEEIVARPEAPLSRLRLLPADEQQRLLFAWNDTAREFPANVCLHQLFEAEAARQPDAVALVCAGAQLTYGELNARANQLAHHLRTLGVGPEVRVGVLLGRSVEMLVAVLGILKAGGAYVPLDPAWPAQRLQLILATLEINCLVTHSAEARTVHDLQWRLPQLAHVISLDTETAAPPVEELDADVVRGFWDHVAERATDEVTAGGFISSYTGEPFSAAEVAEYRARVLALAAPYAGRGARVLEIGCGAGLIMFELAPRVARYVGLDPSPATQARNQAVVAARGLAQVELLTGFAHETGALAAAEFDLVIIASTAQFFPGPGYFRRVIEDAVRLLAPGGTIIVADVLDARRREEFAASLLDYQRRHPSARTKTQAGSELHFDADFFTDLPADVPQLAAVEVRLRTEGFTNELGYRYDVLLHKAATAAAAAPDTCARPARRKHFWTRWHLARLPQANLPTRATSENLAYVIFTSGSTGVPKGVSVRHRSAVNVIDWVNRTFAVGPQDRLLFVTSLTFDLSVYDIFGTLAAGASIHIATRAELRDPERLARLLATEPITFWDSAPAALRQLVPFFPAARAQATDTRLRLVFLSGDWIPLRLPDEVRAAFPGAHVVSLGGATEATVWSNYFPVGRIAEHWASIPYGQPIQNAQYHILDAQLSPCPIGVHGDLYIGGVCLADGYTDPELTAAKFIPNPFARQPGARLYRTGDRARYRASGDIEFLGRTDNQVKVRGFRIELGEIEAALRSHPAVRDCAVVVRADKDAERRLVGYVVARAPAEPTTSELRGYLHERLPEYMLPAAFVLLAQLPTTPNGKLDQAALPAPDAARPTLEASYVAPQTELERLIGRIWQEALGLERVGLDDNFFELGGHSLLMVQVHSRLRAELQRELSIIDLFKYPTIRALARYLGDRAPTPGEHSPSRDRAAARRAAHSARTRGGR